MKRSQVFRARWPTLIDTGIAYASSLRSRGFSPGGSPRIVRHIARCSGTTCARSIVVNIEAVNRGDFRRESEPNAPARADAKKVRKQRVRSTDRARLVESAAEGRCATPFGAGRYDESCGLPSNTSFQNSSRCARPARQTRGRRIQFLLTTAQHSPVH